MFDYIIRRKIKISCRKIRHFLSSKTEHTNDLLRLNAQHTNDRFRLKTEQTKSPQNRTFRISLASKNDDTESFLPSKLTMPNKPSVPSHTYVWNRPYQRCPANFSSFLFGLSTRDNTCYFVAAILLSLLQMSNHWLCFWTVDLIFTINKHFGS